MSQPTAIPRGAGGSWRPGPGVAGATVISGLAGFQDIGPVRRRHVLGRRVTIDDLLRRSVPSRWFVPVTPGTRFVTMGGAFAADIHGRTTIEVRSFSARPRHHADAGRRFGGDRRAHGPALPSQCRGMGLTGVIASLRLRMLPIETSRMVVDTTRISDLEGLLAAMLDADARSAYSVAWVDAGAREEPRTLGPHHQRACPARGSGRWMRSQPLTYSPPTPADAGPRMPNWALNQCPCRPSMGCGSVKRPRGSEIRGFPFLPSTGRGQGTGTAFTVTADSFGTSSSSGCRGREHALEKKCRGAQSVFWLCSNGSGGQRYALVVPRQVGPWPWTYLP